MKVILREAVPTLGKAGEIKEVRMGYGFNFLLPRGLAELATAGNVKRILRLVERSAKKHEAALRALTGIVKKLEGVSVTLKMRSQDGKLFGSVGPTLIAEALKKEGFEVPEEALVLPRPIKKIGSHPVTAKTPEAEAEFTVIVETE